MTNNPFPETVCCYYPGGRISKLEVCVELFMKDWPHAAYRRIDDPHTLERIKGEYTPERIGPEIGLDYDTQVGYYHSWCYVFIGLIILQTVLLVLGGSVWN